MATKKILITGSSAVGKTALFNRFLYDSFGSGPRAAVGLKVDKREVDVKGRKVALILWDLKGEVSQGKVPRTYFLGASAVIYVFDLSRPGSCNNLEADLAILRRALPGCLIRVVGNKKDLLSNEKLRALQLERPADLYTSAKTGENVEALFLDIGRELVDDPSGE